MHHIVDLLRRHGINDVVATLHYLADEIENYFGDGSQFGVSMAYVVEDTPMGTAGAVKLAQRCLGGERFIVVSGDALTDIDLTELIAAHERSGAVATIALQRVANPLEFGVVVTEERWAHHALSWRSRRGARSSPTRSTPASTCSNPRSSSTWRRQELRFSRGYFSALAARRPGVFGHVAGGYWSDIGNLQQYHAGELRRAARRGARRDSGTEIRPGVWVGENCAHFARRARARAGCIGRNVTIERGAVVEELTAIGASSIVAANARLHRTVAWEDVYVGEGSSLTGCTLADRVIVKDRVTIMEGAVIGRGSTLGSGSTVPANIKLWPDKSVASGSIVSMSLIYGIKWPGSLFGADGVSGIGEHRDYAGVRAQARASVGLGARPGQNVMTSRDAHPASRFTNRCIIAGSLSVGVNVHDLREMPTPVSRYAVRMSGDACIAHRHLAA